MKRPFCKICQSEHYSHEPHKFADTPSRPDVGSGASKSGSSDDVVAKSPSVDAGGSGHVAPEVVVPEGPSDKRISERLEVAKKALTRAEISRRQRERDPEGYKKANRARMKRNRRKG